MHYFKAAMHGDMGAADDRNEGNVLPLLVCIKIAQSRGSSAPFGCSCRT